MSPPHGQNNRLEAAAPTTNLQPLSTFPEPVETARIMSSRQSKHEKEREKATQDRLQAMLSEMLKVNLVLSML